MQESDSPNFFCLQKELSIGQPCAAPSSGHPTDFIFSFLADAREHNGATTVLCHGRGIRSVMHGVVSVSAAFTNTAKKFNLGLIRPQRHICPHFLTVR